jgi:indole-3-glycerol phosphate synthase
MEQNILQTILEQKRREIADAKSRLAEPLLRQQISNLPPARPFAESLRRHAQPSIIAEIKRASPSKGVIRPDLDPVATALSYAAGGAACLSVLTDEKFFQGKLEFLTAIRRVLPEVPLLRKDFICDPYQIWQTRVSGADAVLLIVAALAPDELQQLLGEARSVGLDILLEVHTPDELEAALEAVNAVFPAADDPHLPLLGINNRDLKSFVTKLEVTRDVILHGRSLASRFRIGPDALLTVAESGIKNWSDIRQLSAYGAGAFLIGESLVTEGDPGENLRSLIKQTNCRG